MNQDSSKKTNIEITRGAIYMAESSESHSGDPANLKRIMPT
jgi:hypothetical protein